jgi:transcription antitermination factor NusG
MAYRRKGVVNRIRKPLFPGYIFIQTDIEPDLVADKLEMALKSIGGSKHIYSILHYGNDKKDVVLREDERLHWERLFGDDFCIIEDKENEKEREKQQCFRRSLCANFTYCLCNSCLFIVLVDIHFME